MMQSPPARGGRRVPADGRRFGDVPGLVGQPLVSVSPSRLNHSGNRAARWATRRCKTSRWRPRPPATPRTPRRGVQPAAGGARPSRRVAGIEFEPIGFGHSTRPMAMRYAPASNDRWIASGGGRRMVVLVIASRRRSNLEGFAHSRRACRVASLLAMTVGAEGQSDHPFRPEIGERRRVHPSCSDSTASVCSPSSGGGMR